MTLIGGRRFDYWATEGGRREASGIVIIKAGQGYRVYVSAVTSCDTVDRTRDQGFTRNLLSIPLSMHC